MSTVLLEAARVRGAIDSGWAGYMVVGPMEFSLVGIMARLSQCLAAAGVSLLAQSTFDTDYVFVKEADVPSAERAFAAADGIELLPDDVAARLPFLRAREETLRHQRQFQRLRSSQLAVAETSRSRVVLRAAVASMAIAMLVVLMKTTTRKA
jgi:hypothetical protein